MTDVALLRVDGPIAIITIVLGTENAHEGCGAFLEQRKPVFRRR